MIRLASGSSLAFQRLSREPLSAILSVRLAETAKLSNGCLGASLTAVLSVRLLGVANPQENGTDFVTDSQGIPDDVSGLPGGT
eukprot:gene18037-biopygen12936